MPELQGRSISLITSQIIQCCFFSHFNERTQQLLRMTINTLEILNSTYTDYDKSSNFQINNKLL
jgi:hypothetical protein